MALPFLFANASTLATPALDANYDALGALTPVPCLVAGTDSLTLTPLASTPTVAAYSNYMQFTGIAVQTNTSSVSAVVGSASLLPVYKDTSGSPAVLTGGEIVATCAFGLLYDSALNSGNGGFHLMQITGAGGGGSSTSPGGNDTDVQFNDGGFFGGDDSFTFNSGTFRVTLNNLLITGENIRTPVGGSGSGANLDIRTASAASGNNTGGTINVVAGDSIGSNSGPDFGLFGGSGGTTGNGGTTTIQAGAGGATSGIGGFIQIWAGDSNGASAGGEIDILAGVAHGTGIGGAVAVEAGNGQGGTGGEAKLHAGNATGSSGNGGEAKLLAGNGHTNGGAVTITSGHSTSSGNGGLVGITAGAAAGTGTGGQIVLVAGDGGSTSGAGGQVRVQAGSGDASGAGGQIEILCGNAAGVGVGGALALIAGSADTSGVGGIVQLFAGTGVAGAGGAVSIAGGDSFTSGNSGGVTIVAGIAHTAGNGGVALLGAGRANDGSGGDAQVSAGTSFGGNGNGGNTILTYGLKSGSGVDGAIKIDPTLKDFADDTAAAAGGIPITGLYRTASVLKIRVT